MRSRRDFLKKSLLFTSAIIVPSRSSANALEKRIKLYHIHTGEHLDAIFWIDGEYIYDELVNIDYFLRDYRTDEVRKIDVKLLEYLYGIQRRLHANREFNILSGYRSPKTNDYLRHHSKGVAKHSFHMYGRALDIHLPGYHLSTLKYAALSLRRGGVGYYPKSHFIHIDTGAPRYWRYPKR